METLRIDILNPKAKNILKSLADLKLIKIRTAKTSKNDFLDLLERLRAKSDNAPSLEEITREVEKVRQQRYDK